MKTCKTCPCDISHRNGNALFCIECGITARKESIKRPPPKKRFCKDCGDPIDRKPPAQRCLQCSDRRDRMKTAERGKRRRPGKPIRAISPLTDELGRPAVRLSESEKRRGQLPPPDLSAAKWVIKIGKTIYFPKSEKRYLELLRQKAGLF